MNQEEDLFPSQEHLILELTNNKVRSAVRSPQSAVRSLQSAVRSGYAVVPTAARTAAPRSAVHVLQSAVVRPQNTIYIWKVFEHFQHSEICVCSLVKFVCVQYLCVWSPRAQRSLRR